MINDKKQIPEEGQVALYGAGMVGVSIYYAIKTLYRNCNITSFIVSKKEGNPREIDHTPVVSLEEFSASDVEILVAVPEIHHNAIAAELERRDLKKYICIDSAMEASLMEKYYEKIRCFPSLHSYISGEKSADIDVYMTRFHRDTPLKNSYEFPEWIYPIQAGAALTKEYIADIGDNTGDNISEKNVNYSELSVMYWLGKNAIKENIPDKYLGMFHYRRILDIKGEDLYRIEKNGIDIILPYPTVHYPSINEHHKRYVKDSDWEAMICALKELTPEYAEKMPHIFSQPYFYNYNMFVAKSHIFKEFCDWMFPILRRTEELSSPKGWERADRYIGYLGENLTTLYFMYHKNYLKIVHTGRIMLI